MDDKKRKRLVTNEIRRLTLIFKEVDSKKQRTLKGLIDEAAFMRATLTELKEIIQDEGVIDEMPQGEYSIIREHPALKSYNSTIQRYTTVTEKLLGVLPKDTPKTNDDVTEFFDFLNKRTD
ncbi:hypothetical protein [Lactococcus petauri]|uniref:hypothetical protein n=1 Tax=Lactococcus petauri TaxID=1940789 RepID=UPI00254B0A06|nr:hypothetical protein [Lactococcus petauri]